MAFLWIPPHTQLPTQNLHLYVSQASPKEEIKFQFLLQPVPLSIPITHSNIAQNRNLKSLILQNLLPSTTSPSAKHINSTSKSSQRSIHFSVTLLTLH